MNTDKLSADLQGICPEAASVAWNGECLVVWLKTSANPPQLVTVWTGLKTATAIELYHNAFAALLEIGKGMRANLPPLE